MAGALLAELHLQAVGEKGEQIVGLLQVGMRLHERWTGEPPLTLTPALRASSPVRYQSRSVRRSGPARDAARESPRSAFHRGAQRRSGARAASAAANATHFRSRCG